jgi:hypothetical protein
LIKYRTEPVDINLEFDDDDDDEDDDVHKT